MLIGNGVFPNVYVDNIIIYDHEVRFDVFVLDSEEQPVWSNKEHLRGKLQIKIYCPINEQAQSNSIVLGESSFTKNDEGVVSYYLFDFHSSIVTEGTFAGHKVYRKTIVKQIPQDLSDLSIFSNLFIGQDEGTITGETVVINNNISQTTKILLKNGAQYYGPAHQHDGIYMEGATHTDEPHSTLTAVSLPNLKIRDHRKYSYNYKKLYKSDRIPTFSNLIKSFDEDTKHNYMFFVNMEEILIARTKYGRVLRNVNENTFLEIMNKLKIRFLKIDRKKINSYFRDIVGGSKKKSRAKVIETANVLRANESSTKTLYTVAGENISFISHNFSNSVYGFFFNDSVDDHTHGDYQYLIEFSFSDPTIEYVRGVFVDIKNAIEQANRYLDILSMPANYNYFMKKPKQNFADSIPFQNDLDVVLAERINSAKRMIFDIPEEESVRDLIRMYSLLNHKTCSIESVNLFIEEAELTLNKYLQIFELSEQKIKKNYLNASGITKKSVGDRITIEHTFKEIITPSDSRYHYSYSYRKQSDNQKISTPKKAASFGTRRDMHNFNFNTSEGKSKFNNLINMAKGEGTARSSTTVSRMTQVPDEFKKEKHINSTEYLGANSTFNTKEDREGCAVQQHDSNLTDEISIGIETGDYNMEDTAANTVQREVEILHGFERSDSGTILVNKLIWHMHDSGTPEGTVIVKYKQDNTLSREISFSHTNEYVLLNNNSNIGVGSQTPKPSVIRNMSNKVRPYDMSLSSNNIVENGNASNIADYTPRNAGTQTSQATTNMQPSSQGAAMQPISQISTTGGSTY